MNKKHYYKLPKFIKKHRNSKHQYSVWANVERTIAHLTWHGTCQTSLVDITWNNFKLVIHGAVKNIMTIPVLMGKICQRK